MVMDQVKVGGWRRWSAAVVLSALACVGVRAQTFPDHPVRIVVPFGPGGVGDLTARAVAKKLSEQWHQPVVIDNRAGAGGVTAAEAVVKAAPDGYTLFLMSNGTAVTQSLFKQLPFDARRDFAPVSTLGYFDIAVVVPAASPLRSLKDWVAQAQAHPGRLNLGSINVGSTQHLTAELFKSSARMDVQVVPFNGTPALVSALRGAQVDGAVELLGAVLPQVKAQALRVLAVTGERRSPQLPDVPTARESGIEGFVASSWNALAAPAKTPSAVLERLQHDISAAVQSPEVKRQLQDLNVDARASTQQQLADLLASDVRRWSQVIEQAHIPRQ